YGRRRGPLLVALAALAVAVVVVAVILLIGAGGSPTHAGSSSSSAAAAGSSAARHGAKRHASSRKASTAAVVAADVTVTVLNGTSVNHLAADVLGRLTTDGYKGGTTNNASDQSMTSTIVGYTQLSDRADALAVAKSLGLGAANVQAVSQGDQAIACPSPTACTAQVVVSVGQDLASSAG
ncbi:MAG: LytR C-terminal domain-containing protein, partial [Solirubrobacteraceae bacterium]